MRGCARLKSVRDGEHRRRTLLPGGGHVFDGARQQNDWDERYSKRPSQTLGPAGCAIGMPIVLMIGSPIVIGLPEVIEAFTRNNQGRSVCMMDVDVASRPGELQRQSEQPPNA